MSKKKKKKYIKHYFKTTKSKIKISFILGYVIGFGLQITELKILFQSDIPPRTLATTFFLFSVFFCMYA